MPKNDPNGFCTRRGSEYIFLELSPWEFVENRQKMSRKIVTIGYLVENASECLKKRRFFYSPRVIFRDREQKGATIVLLDGNLEEK